MLDLTKVDCSPKQEGLYEYIYCNEYVFMIFLGAS